MSKAYQTLTACEETSVDIGSGGRGGGDINVCPRISLSRDEVFLAGINKMARDLYTSDVKLDIGQTNEISRRSFSHHQGNHEKSSSLRELVQPIRFRSFSLARKSEQTSGYPLMSFKSWMQPKSNGEREKASSKDNKQKINRRDGNLMYQIRDEKKFESMAREVIQSVNSDSPSISVSEREDLEKLRENRPNAGRVGSFQQAAAALVIGQFGSLRLQKDPQRNIYNETEL